MGNKQTTGVTKRPARIVGDRPHLARFLPKDMCEGAVLVRLWLTATSTVPELEDFLARWLDGPTGTYARSLSKNN